VSWNKHHINNLLLNPRLLSTNDLEQLKKLCNEFPYVGIVALSYLEGLHKNQDIRFANELSNFAHLISNRVRLYFLLEDNHQEIEHVLEEPSARTPIATESNDAIANDPLNLLIEQSAASALYHKTLADNVEKMPFELTLLHPNEMEKPVGSPIQGKNSEEYRFSEWLSKGNFTQTPTENSTDQTKPASVFYSVMNKAKESVNSERIPVSETLAKIFIIQGNLPKAMAIYEQLILAVPEKKAYFVGQIKKITKKISE